MQLPIISTKAAFAQFSETLQAEGVREALAYLLRLTDYRFIGVFRFENGVIDAVVHYDRENPTATKARRTADAETYCSHVRDSKQTFATADALTDSRLQHRPERESLVAYCGVPVMDANGAMLGTLCHYDFVPRDPGQIDIALMQDVAGVLAAGETLRTHGRGADPVRVPRRQEESSP
ncbi:GAF domain protein [Variovorax sp. SRS16]|uniref:GAF domain-containing protein n=1 Tax=Variovorax sp. SRS16 TaxID=282217 RepID=UPI00131779BB|nr:GAF domain-containing protein [Variovorax sp. SRS16]VTU22419.1 GAF domain protein [Variovorax sp. SRS16]